MEIPWRRCSMCMGGLGRYLAVLSILTKKLNRYELIIFTAKNIRDDFKQQFRTPRKKTAVCPAGFEHVGN